jgi:hypothetical protein
MTESIGDELEMIGETESKSELESDAVEVDLSVPVKYVSEEAKRAEPTGEEWEETKGIRSIEDESKEVEVEAEVTDSSEDDCDEVETIG